MLRRPRARLIWAWAGACWGFILFGGAIARGALTFKYDFQGPDEVSGVAGQTYTETYACTIISSGVGLGPQSWCMSLTVAPGGVTNITNITNITTAGSVVEALMSGGFERTEVVAGGAVSCVVLSISDSNITLPANTSQQVAFVDVALTIGATPTQATLRYVDGLGTPTVDNTITSEGTPRVPSTKTLTVDLIPTAAPCPNDSSLGTTRYNPRGWIQMEAWNLLVPLLHQSGCSAGGEVNMLRNWVAPHDMTAENPRAATLWGDIDFGGPTPGATGYSLGGLSPEPLWLTLDFLNGLFPDLAPVAGGDIVDLQRLMDHFLLEFVPAVPGLLAPPTDNVFAVATTYVENTTGGNLAVEICTSSDDSIQVYVNSDLTINESACRPIGGGCSEVAAATLPPGVSKLTALVWDGVFAWSFRLGIRSGGELLRDDNPCVRFLGPEGPGLPGESRYRLTRTATAPAGGCPSAGAVPVRVTGSGPGNPASVLTVTETILARHVESLNITGVSHGGVVTDAPPLPRPPATPVGEFDSRGIVGRPCSVAGTTTSFDAGTARYTSRAETGGDIWSCGDTFEYAYSRLQGDFDVALRFDSLAHATNLGRWGKFGLMARRSLDADARYTMIQDHLPDPSDPARVAGRTTHRPGCGGMYEAVLPGDVRHPSYIRLTRRGNVLQGWFTNNAAVEADPGDDSRWTMAHADNWGAGAPAELFVGFANSDHSAGGCADQTIEFTILRFAGTEVSLVDTEPIGKQITWTVSRATVSGGLTYSLNYSRTGATTHIGAIAGVAFTEGRSRLPFNSTQAGPVGEFEEAHDIGGPQTPGSTVYNSVSQTYTLTGSGFDIWNDGDQFHFAYRAVTGDFLVEARITNRVDPPGGTSYGKHGLMARWSCDAAAKFSMVQTMLATNDADVAEPRHAFRVSHLVAAPTRHFYTLADGALPGFDGAASSKVNRRPEWMRLVRIGNAIYSYLAFDDGGQPLEWRLVGSDAASDMPETLLVGMALTSHAGAATGQISFTDLRYLELPALGPLVASPPVPFRSYNFDAALPAEAVVVQGGSFRPGVVNNRLRLTEEGTGGSANAVWFTPPGTEALSASGFEVEFDVFFSKTGVRTDPDANPADGMTFAVVTYAGDDPRDPFPAGLGLSDLRGDAGGALGYQGGTLRERTAGRPGSGFAVELDNWVGGGEPPNEPVDGGSPDFDGNWHLGINVNASVSSVQTNVDFGVPTAALPDIYAPEGVHVEIVYRPDGHVDVFVSANDGPGPRQQVLSADIAPLRGSFVFGYTAATGIRDSRGEIDNIIYVFRCHESCDAVCLAPSDPDCLTPDTRRLTLEVGQRLLIPVIFDGRDVSRLPGGEPEVLYDWSWQIEPPGAALVYPDPTSCDPSEAPTETVCAQYIVEALAAGVVTLHVTGEDTRCLCDIPGSCMDCEPRNEDTREIDCVTSGGKARPGDFNLDGGTDISDPVYLLLFLFGGQGTLPCGNGGRDDPANLTLADWNGDGDIDISDPLASLNFLFGSGPPHIRGSDCRIIPGCPVIRGVCSQ